MPQDEEDPPRGRPAVSRRTLIGGIVAGAAVVAAASVAGAQFLPGLLGRSSDPHPTTPTPTPAPTRSVGDGLLVDQLVRRPGFTVAHRGGSLDWPEMSLEAYRNSVALGVNALEISVARTVDGVWFGLHDETLDRTSGTSGFVAAQHTWKEVQAFRITAAETNHRSQAPQPYLRFEDLVAAYGRTHTIFVDPKVVPVSHFGELFALMAAVKHPAETFVAKGYCTAQAWPVDAQARGYTTWGYYYGSEIGADPTMLPTTKDRWTWLGLDVGASAEQWQAFTATGKPVLAHIVRSRDAADQSTTNGAQGLVVSGVREVLA